MLGIPIANVLGVPGATWLGQTFGWRSAYWLVALIGVATVGLLAYAVPQLRGDSSRTVRWYLLNSREIGTMRSFITVSRS